MSTLLEVKIKEPILVKNPHTNQYVNVAPLFDAIHQIGEPLKAVITRTLRTVNLNAKGEDIIDINYELYLLEDTFTAMFEGTKNEIR